MTPDYELAARRFSVLGRPNPLRILAVMLRHFPCSTRDVDLGKELGLDDTEVRDALAALSAQGLLRTFGTLDTYYQADVDLVRELMDLVWLDTEREIVW